MEVGLMYSMTTPLQQGAIAKWLRRQIRNLFLFEGVGSNPAGVDLFCVLVLQLDEFPNSNHSQR